MYKRLLILLASLIPDKLYLKLLFKVKMGYNLDLSNPKTYNEKCQYIKLYNHNPIYTVMVDKIKMKQYIAEKIGSQYVIPIICIYNTVEEINFDNLPEKFVIKCNHNSGLGMYICRDKSSLNINKVKNELKKGLNQNYYKIRREWPYKDVKRQILVEKYMQNGLDENLTDYKFFCFNGEPKIMYISKDNAKIPTTDFFDMNFNHIELRMKDKNSNNLPSKPEKFEEMKNISKILSKGIPFLRVDFYHINNKIYVGELTFFHNAGFVDFHPKEWDTVFGKWITLTNNLK